MKNRWKALASVAVAAALVVAPLTVGAASAHTGNLNGQAVCNPQTGQYDITYMLTLSNVGAETTGVTHWGVGSNTFTGTPTDATGLTEGPHDSTGNTTFSLGTYSVPGTSTAGPWVYAFTQFSNEVKLGSDGRVDVLAGDCKPADKPVTPPTPTWTDPCGPDNGSWTAPEFEGGHWAYGSGEGIEYIDAVADDGYVFPEGTQTQWSGDVNDEECWQPTAVTPVLTWDLPSCDEPGAVTSSFEQEGIHWTEAEGDNGSTIYTAHADDDYVLAEGAQHEWTVPNLTQLDSDDPHCRQVYPVPTLFNTGDPQPTCANAAEYLTPEEFGAPGEDGWYSFEHVWVYIDRSVEGEVTISVESKSGYTLGDLNGSWWISEDSTYAERTILLHGAIGYQSEDSTQPCFFAILPQPEAPVFTDDCGTATDGFTVPENSEAVRYETVHEGAIVTITAVLVNDEDEFAEGVTTQWSHTFTNEACPTAAPPLAATGGNGVSPILPIGAGALVMLGLALLVTRRLARH